MVDIQEPQLDAVFHALGDRTRRHMLRRLAEGERTVGQLAEPFNMSLAAASKHIKALEGAGLVRREVLGRTHVCHLNPGPLSVAGDWLRYYERFWNARLDRLEALLRAEATEPAAGPPSRPARAPARTAPTPKPTKTKRSST
ncbi:putative transcriptional regulator [Burkholderiales bacterium JOSHI_001]|nr:putative transcriptional regulator [Burkholderiales bacterium JOSHI_001]